MCIYYIITFTHYSTYTKTCVVCIGTQKRVTYYCVNSSVRALLDSGFSCPVHILFRLPLEQHHAHFVVLLYADRHFNDLHAIASTTGFTALRT